MCICRCIRVVGQVGGTGICVCVGGSTSQCRHVASLPSLSGFRGMIQSDTCVMY